MRPLVATENITLDGVIESPEEWSGPYQSPDLGEFMHQGLPNSDAMLFGRVTYEKFAAFWPDADMEPFASKMRETQKYVASTTLDTAPWGNHAPATILNGNLRDEINRLKQQDGKAIAVLGSGNLVRSLLRDNLVDELHLFVHPLVLGRGTRLFEDNLNVSLKLIESRAFDGGIVMLSYRPS